VDIVSVLPGRAEATGASPTTSDRFVDRRDRQVL
jgi:hypothetical protein